MKNYFLVVIATLFITSSGVAEPGPVFSIEEETLLDLDADSAAVIKLEMKADADWLNDCSLIFKSVRLSPSESEVKFVTTKDGCGWGAAAGPIYLLKGEGKEATLILSASGNMVALHKGKSLMPDLDISADTAGVSASKRFHFDGKRYKAGK